MQLLNNTVNCNFIHIKFAFLLISYKFKFWKNILKNQKHYPMYFCTLIPNLKIVFKTTLTLLP